MTSDQAGAKQTSGAAQADGAAQAGGAAQADASVPPSGWEVSHDGEPGGEEDSLAALVEQLLELLPEELRTRLTEALRQLLEVVRALIDWCVQRLEQRHREPVEVRDIPVI